LDSAGKTVESVLTNVRQWSEAAPFYVDETLQNGSLRRMIMANREGMGSGHGGGLLWHAASLVRITALIVVFSLCIDAQAV